MKNRKDRTHILSEINIPVQFIAGKKDLSIAFENIIQQSKKCNTADLCIFEDIGHTSMHENPKILLEAIIGFIDDKFPHSKS
jgi:pimeloyl-ACP methyl ester carboxylesterase